jgi:hypothetical protein
MVTRFLKCKRLRASRARLSPNDLLVWCVLPRGSLGEAWQLKDESSRREERAAQSGWNSESSKRQTLCRYYTAATTRACVDEHVSANCTTGRSTIESPSFPSCARPTIGRLVGGVAGTVHAKPTTSLQVPDSSFPELARCAVPVCRPTTRTLGATSHPPRGFASVLAVCSNAQIE